MRFGESGEGTCVPKTVRKSSPKEHLRRIKIQTKELNPDQALVENLLNV